MPVFATSEEIHGVMSDLWHRVKADPAIARPLIESKLSAQFRFREPEGIVTIDCTDGLEMKIIIGPCDFKPTIEMAMKGDVAHEFWMGRISVPVAILTGKIVSKGPTPKALALLPIIRPAFDLYPKVLEEAGKQALMSR